MQIPLLLLASPSLKTEYARVYISEGKYLVSSNHKDSRISIFSKLVGEYIGNINDKAKIDIDQSSEYYVQFNVVGKEQSISLFLERI